MSKMYLAKGAYGAVAVDGTAAVEITGIAGLDFHPRVAVHFINLGANAIYYGFDDQVDETSGIELGVGKDVFYEGQIRIWARCISTESADVRVALFG